VQTKDKANHKQGDQLGGSDVRPIEAPSGLDLHPRPRKIVRVSKRTTILVLAVVVLLLAGFAYGAYRRTLNQATGQEAGFPKSATAATQASDEFVQAIPVGTAPLESRSGDELKPPEDTNQRTAKETCGYDPRTGQPYRYNPQTGQLCDGLPQERVVVRRSPVRNQSGAAAANRQELSPEEQRIMAAYRREQEAIAAPTGVRDSNTGKSRLQRRELSRDKSARYATTASSHGLDESPELHGVGR
jgi:hypothetical protein